MNELATTIGRIQHGETEAYAVVIEQFQNMAVGYAYAALGDLALAEDVAQEAFIAA
ncbi:MAG: sigma factor [Caldilineaceae bacterium]